MWFRNLVHLYHTCSEIWHAKAQSLESFILGNVNQWLEVVVFPGVSFMGDKLGENVNEEINTVHGQIKDKF